MKVARPQFPLEPLLRAYTAAGLASPEGLERLPDLGPRFRAVLAARGELLSERFLDGAGAADFEAALLRFYEACVPPGLHAAALVRRAGVVRHALGHLLRCPDPLPRKAARCLATDGAYSVPGLGPAFWSALFQGLDPQRHPAWTPAVITGLRRLGLDAWQAHDGPAAVYATLLETYARLRASHPGLTALHVDHFLTLVARMRGRDLFVGTAAAPDVVAALRQVRAGLPLRRRLKERGQALHEAGRGLEDALALRDGRALRAALAVADPGSVRRAPVRWRRHGETLALWVGRLWESGDPYQAVADFGRADPLPGAGLWLPAAVLHLKDAQHYLPWSEPVRYGYDALDDSGPFTDDPAERYRLLNEGAARLRDPYQVHPLELPDVLASLAGRDDAPRPAGRAFGGFCADTFTFLGELAKHNCRAWMEAERGRYAFAVREPLRELCRALAEGYVEPVLRRERGWDLETAARSGRALTSICKNDYGRSVPYQTALWITFYRRDRGGKQDDVQFFVRLDAAGLGYGLLVGAAAREAGTRFRANVARHADLLHRALREGGALATCRFTTDEALREDVPVTSPAELRSWAGAKTLAVVKSVAAGAGVPATEELVGDILLTFDRLLPAYACAVEDDPLPLLAERAGAEAPEAGYGEDDFRRATFLDADWLRQARSLLALKRQVILQGVPGTGKTHVARCLARLLTGGRDEAVRLVQFHPAYSYEEFVEGIKVRTVEVNGRSDVSYPVEEGLLCAFAAEAARRPDRPHVLLVDEINRGNLPRIFGELLYLLEYREQALVLPYSKREFRLPANLYLVGTMNAADRSVALVDQALRRRFSFLDMPPDAAVLAAWLAEHPPTRPEFAGTVVALFERLNVRLRADLGPLAQVGHSYFMVADLDEARLRVVWEHQVWPLLEEYFAGHPGRLAAYELDRLRGGERRPAGRRKREPAEVV